MGKDVTDVDGKKREYGPLRVLKSAVMWLFAVTSAVLGIVFVAEGHLPAGCLALLCAVMAGPVPWWQEKLGRLIPGKIRMIAVLVLAGAAVFAGCQTGIFSQTRGTDAAGESPAVYAGDVRCVYVELTPGEKGDDAEALPGDDAEELPGDGEEALPGDDAEELPGDGEEALPGDDAEVLPGDDAEVLSGDDADTLPGDDADALPGDGEDALPGDDAEVLPEDDAEELPEDDAEELPGDGEDALPGDDAEVLPEDDAEELPGDDAEELPGDDAEVLPGDDAETPGNIGNADDYDYVLNKSSKKIHYPYCSSVDDMKDKNKYYFKGTRYEAMEKGYSPCGICKP